MTLAGWLETQARRVWDWVRGKDRPHGKPRPKPIETVEPRSLRFPWWLPVLCLLVWGCQLPTEGIVETVNPEWIMGWREAEACSGRQGDVNRIRWHVVAESSAVMQYGHLVGFTAGHDIYLSAPWAGYRWLARHESLHALGIHHHPPDIFVTRCHATWGALEDTLDLGALGKGVG